MSDEVMNNAFSPIVGVPYSKACNNIALGVNMSHRFLCLLLTAPLIKNV